MLRKVVGVLGSPGADLDSSWALIQLGPPSLDLACRHRGRATLLSTKPCALILRHLLFPPSCTSARSAGSVAQAITSLCIPPAFFPRLARACVRHAQLPGAGPHHHHLSENRAWL